MCPVFCFCHKGGYSYDYAYGLAVAADNSAFLAGTKYRSAGSGWDYAIVKLDADGDFLWDWQVRFALKKCCLAVSILNIVLIK